MDHVLGFKYMPNIQLLLEVFPLIVRWCVLSLKSFGALSTDWTIS